MGEPNPSYIPDDTSDDVLPPAYDDISRHSDVIAKSRRTKKNGSDGSGSSSSLPTLGSPSSRETSGHGTATSNSSFYAFENSNFGANNSNSNTNSNSKLRRRSSRVTSLDRKASHKNDVILPHYDVDLDGDDDEAFQPPPPTTPTILQSQTTSLQNRQVAAASLNQGRLSGFSERDPPISSPTWTRRGFWKDDVWQPVEPKGRSFRSKLKRELNVYYTVARSKLKRELNVYCTVAYNYRRR